MDEVDVVDLGQLDNFKGDVDFYRELLELFDSEYAAHLEGLQAAIDAEDMKAIYEHAHAMKGISLDVGAKRLGHTVSQICQLSRSLEKDEAAKISAIRDVYALLGARLTRFQEAIAEIMPTWE
eukprot:TRINITY_DN9072_c1_g1_i1.p2 TRINITY_DN9072_c1_g1~~TRINITY_DN9072_c1_g1_i1.p2  ORF type:complete len:123 (+),score=60.72 TRINITY_DN9072_c1_g1_i1:163-531(+)